MPGESVGGILGSGSTHRTAKGAALDAADRVLSSQRT